MRDPKKVENDNFKLKTAFKIITKSDLSYNIIMLNIFVSLLVRDGVNFLFIIVEFSVVSLI
jgi:hypothetical protein